MLFKPEFDSRFQVDVSRKNNSVSPRYPLVREGEREPISMLFEPEFDSRFQVDVSRKNNSVSVPSTPWGEG